jgi:hypothetical protein
VCGAVWNSERGTGRFVVLDLETATEIRGVPVAAGLGEVLHDGRAAVSLTGVVSLPGLVRRGFAADLLA